MVTRKMVLGLLVLLVACSDGDGADLVYDTLTHRFEPVPADPGEELWDWCQSWGLENTEPLYVTAVRQRNDGAWHHSNWFYVPEDLYEGPHGTWRCSDRGYHEVTAGFTGGVFFAQSTQALEEEQVFPPGFALRVPPDSSIVGGIHILNLSDEAIETSIELEADLIAEEDVVEVLQPMSFTNMALNIPPNARSEFAMDCMFEQPTDFDMHYVLAHYHDLGELLSLEVIGGELDGDTVFETTSATGEPLGATLDPPAEVRGAEGLRLTCGYYSQGRPDTVGYGIGDQEMCVFLAYLTGPMKYGGTSTGDTSEQVGSEDGVLQFETDCVLVGVEEP